MDEQLTTRQVAEALSVSESSVKRWCDRGLIPTVRTVGGHRRIPLPGFLEFLEQTDRQVVSELPFKSLPAAESGSEKLAPLGELRQEFRAALAAGHESRCRQILLSWYRAKGSFATLADEFIATTMREMGDLWDCGDLEVYQERRGCEICARLLHEFRRLIPDPPANAPLAIGGAVEGDQYTLATQIVEIVLRESNWRAMNLGSNLPMTTLAAAAHEHRPRLLWLSVSHLQDEAKFIGEYQQLAASIPAETMILIGGRALTDSVRPKLEYTGHCDNMRQLTSFAAALHGKRPHIGTSDN